MNSDFCNRKIALRKRRMNDSQKADLHNWANQEALERLVGGVLERQEWDKTLERGIYMDDRDLSFSIHVSMGLQASEMCIKGLPVSWCEETWKPMLWL